MKPESVHRGTARVKQPPATVRSSVLWRGKPPRELFLVKFAFWAVVVGIILLIAFVL
jgi:hypothetical protein